MCLSGINNNNNSNNLKKIFKLWRNLKTWLDHLKGLSIGTSELLQLIAAILLTAVTWKDNKAVIFLSSYVGAEPVSQVERFDKANKTRSRFLTHILYRNTMPIWAEWTSWTASLLLQLYSVTNEEGPAPVPMLKWKLKPKKGEGLFNMFHIRTDNVGHWPDWCKMPRCKGYTRTRCEKCRVALCLTKSKHCFKEFYM
ncbi:unnamed protein product [Pieris macdunnoughi]|uniref:Uncharacterized protein n=1 Tax=Pieris macdunnoughi TaxID=345717 RepID=A0A821XQ85_9NEOP|nr:unnamed protein product [Pieris macdunnoughi]